MGHHPEEDLARLAAATSDIEAPADFTDRVMGLVREADHPIFAQVARATRDLEPSAALADSVMRGVRETDRSPASDIKSKPTSKVVWLDGITRGGVGAVLIAAAVAAGCVLFASYTEGDLDAHVIATVDSVEAGE